MGMASSRGLPHRTPDGPNGVGRLRRIIKTGLGAPPKLLRRARRVLNRALGSRPRDAAHEIDLGNACEEQANLEGAIACCLQPAPHSPGAVSNAGESLSQGAVGPEAISQLGSSLKEQGRIEEALAHFQAASSLYPPETSAFALDLIDCIDRYYETRLPSVSEGTQVFFLMREDFGVILMTLLYGRLWMKHRGPICYAVFIQSEAFDTLVSILCPGARVIKIDKQIAAAVHRKLFHIVIGTLAFRRPNAISLINLSGCQDNYLRHLERPPSENGFSKQFEEAYFRFRSFELNHRSYIDLLRLSATTNHPYRASLEQRQELRIKLGISPEKEIVILSVSFTHYGSAPPSPRRVRTIDRYDGLIDELIASGYAVVIFGAKDQPVFEPRDNLIDYAHSTIQTPANDLILASDSAFFISGKTGNELYAWLCDAPMLGLNYTELSQMQGCSRCRFFPKGIRRRSDDKLLSYAELLADPVFFHIGDDPSWPQNYEFIDMTPADMLAALREFFILLKQPREAWSACTPLQRHFKSHLASYHLDLFHIPGMPCDSYLRRYPATSGGLRTDEQDSRVDGDLTNEPCQAL